MFGTGQLSWKKGLSSGPNGEGDMHRRLLLVAVAATIGLRLTGSAAIAGPQEDVAAATANWARAFGDNNPETILPLYAGDAVLWGTLSPTLRNDPGAIKAYFAGAFNALPKATVKFGDQMIRIYGNTAVNTGYYTFSYVKDGEAKSIPARYSMTFVREGDKWMIVDHHSSAMPPAPAVAPAR
jgi:uncharacterized protein (TIGR02246 family)